MSRQIAQFDPSEKANGLFNIFNYWGYKALVGSETETEISIFEGQQGQPLTRCNLPQGILTAGQSFDAYNMKLAIVPPIGTPWTLATRQAADDLMARCYVEFKINGSLIAQLSGLTLETNRPGVASSGGADTLMNGQGINPDQVLNFGSLPHTWPENTVPDYKVYFQGAVPAALAGFDIVGLFVGTRDALNASQIS